MQKYSLPNLTEIDEIQCRYNILNGLYTFEFIWCDFFFLLDIYTENFSEKSYLVKGIPLVTNINLIRNTNLKDRLVIENIYRKKLEPSKENLHTDFELVWYKSDD